MGFSDASSGLDSGRAILAWIAMHPIRLHEISVCLVINDANVDHFYRSEVTLTFVLVFWEGTMRLCKYPNFYPEVITSIGAFG